MKTRLVESRSRIYLLFNIQTSLSTTAVISIYAYFLGKDIRLHHSLIALKEIFGHHEDEVITEVVAKVITQWDIASNLGVWVSDNAGNINTTVKALMRQFLLNELNPNVRRSRYLGYIINLAAKAFLLRDNYEAFKPKIKANEI